MFQSAKWTFAFVLCSAFSAVAGGATMTLPEQLEGRYQGNQIRLGESRSVVAEISPVEIRDGEETVSVEMAETKGNAKSQTLLLGFSKVRLSGWGRAHYKYKSIRLSGSLLWQDDSSSFLELKIEGSCGEGEGNIGHVRLCLDGDQFDMAVTSSNQAKIFSFHLQKGTNLPPFSGDAADQGLTLDQFMGRAKFSNYAVAQEAQRVFQARKGIQVGIGNLLPKFNIGNLLSFAVDGPLGIVSSIGNFLPFLFPSNWYSWKESKQLYWAELSSFASLRGNEMNNVEGLFYLVQRDVTVLKLLTSHLSWLEKIRLGIEEEEKNFILPSGSGKFFEEKVTLIQQDYVTLNALVETEIAYLAQSVNLPPVDGIKGINGIKFIDIPDLSMISKIDPHDYFKEAQEKSHEMNSLRHLQEAAKYETKRKFFSFLDPSSDGTIGFGTGATIAIGRSQVAEIGNRMEETLGLIEQKSAELASQHNRAIDFYKLSLQTIKSKKARFEQTLQRHIMGDPTLNEWDYLEQLADLSKNMIEVEAQKITSAHSYLIARSKLARLLLQGFYADLEKVLPKR